MSIILGYDNPKIIRTTSGDANVTIYSLPLSNLNGRQIETYEPKGIEHELISLDISNPTFEISQSLFGYYITWNLSYSDFIEGTDLMYFQEIILGAINGDTFQLIPRAGESWRYFDVNLVLNPFSVGICTGGANANFNKDFQISFRTKRAETDFKWALITPPDTRIFAWINNQSIMRVSI